MTAHNNTPDKDDEGRLFLPPRRRRTYNWRRIEALEQENAALVVRLNAAESVRRIAPPIHFCSRHGEYEYEAHCPSCQTARQKAKMDVWMTNAVIIIVLSAIAGFVLGANTHIQP